MRSRPRSKKRCEEESRRLEARMYEAFKAQGWQVPRTADEVAQAEAELAEAPVELPAALQTPPDLDTRDSALTQEPSRRPILQGPKHIYEGMARAAREGRRISEETERVLRRDRETAERQRDQDHHDVQKDHETSL